MIITEVAIIMLYLVILASVVAMYLQIRKFRAEIEQLFDHTARITKVLAEHEQRFEMLTVNEPRQTDEETDKKEQKADNDYNEGMNNIFGYSVETGIRVGDE